MESLLRRGAKRRGAKAATLAPLAAKGGELGQLLHGMPAAAWIADGLMRSAVEDIGVRRIFVFHLGVLDV